MQKEEGREEVLRGPSACRPIPETSDTRREALESWKTRKTAAGRVIRWRDTAIGTYYKFRGPKSHRPMQVFVPNEKYQRLMEMIMKFRGIEIL